VPGQFDSPLTVRLDLPGGAAAACPLFVGRLLRGVRNGPAPRWLQEKLKSVGLRPISALVDITNYFTLDRNRPLHVFDADAVAGQLVVRLSRAGETIAALNDRTYTLDDAVTVIADDDGVVSLGGVIGGSSTGVTPETVNVFVEAALFDPLRTAATGRKLGIESDARYRFERGVDPDAVFAGMEQATAMILEICGGEASHLTVAGKVPDWRRTLALRSTRVEHLGGVAVPLAEQMRILAALGFGVAEDAGGLVQAEVPSWRSDVHGEADLVEEVLRVAGFDAIPEVPLPRTSAVTKAAVTPAQKGAALARRALAARGLDEVVTWSFMAADLARHFGGGEESLALVNPIASDLDTMRPSILPNLVQAAGRNAARGLPDAALFEIGPAYRSPRPDGQELVAAGVRTGASGPRHWALPPRPVDAFDARADAFAALEAAGAPVDKLQVSADAPGWYHPGRSGCLRLGPLVLARFGELHPAVLEAMDAAGPVAAFEAILSAVPQPKRKPGSARPPLALSPLQPVTRDFAFVVAESVPAERLIRAVRAADRALIADVGVFDVWRGPALGPGRKSIALSVTIQPATSTMTDAELEALARKIVAQAERQAGAVLRS
jgi:phenylalanyl-tRNA synthetase beta chain